MQHEPHQPTIWITGARQGLGAALAATWAARGARLVLCSRRWREGEAEQRVSALRKAGASRVDVDTVDVSDVRQVRRWVDRTLSDGCMPDVVVHNAAVLGPRLPLSEVAVSDWEEVFRVNVHGAFYLLRTLAPHLDADRPVVWAWIISSVARRGRAGWGPYAASKAALLNLHQTFSEEIATSAWRSLALNPGGTRTAMRAAAMPDEDPSTVPAPADVAAAILRIIDAARSDDVDNGADVDVRDWM